jgi:hypothetical protein
MARENAFAAESVTFDAKAATEIPTSDICQQRTLKVLASIMTILTSKIREHAHGEI